MFVAIGNRKFVLQKLATILLVFLSPSSIEGQNLVVQQPTFGVSIDPNGVLTAKAFPGGKDLILNRVAAAKANLGGDLFRPTDLRYVSLRRLDEAISNRLAEMKQPTEAMMRLAGLLRVEYVFAIPEQNDVVIAGPAEGWIESPARHVVGVTSGLPTLHLEDLTTAFHVFDAERPADQWVGCSIGPGPGAMKRLQEFNRTIPRSIRQGTEKEHAQRILEGTIKSLGMAGVVTFGIDSDTHMARRMIEADYRMKSIGIGVEPPPVPMKTFYSQIKAPPRSVLQRWWLVPDYERIGLSDDRMTMKLVGAGVKLLTENYKKDGKGGLKPSGEKPSNASLTYTRSFNSQFEKIAKMSSAFGQLRNSIDLLIAAAFLRREKLYEKTGFDPKWIHDERIDYSMTARIKNAPCLINSKWAGRRFFTLAGGGVSVVPAEAFEKKNLLKVDPAELDRKRPDRKDIPNWWWDQ